MLTRLWDMNDPLSTMFALERQMNTAFDQAFRGARGSRGDAQPWLLRDEGERLVLCADLPGFTHEDIDVTVEGDVVTLRGERKFELPAGFKVVRAERPKLRFLNQIDLPCRVAADEIEATLKDGVLTLAMPKAPEAKPRKIAIRRGAAERPAIDQTRNPAMSS